MAIISTTSRIADLRRNCCVWCPTTGGARACLVIAMLATLVVVTSVTGGLSLPSGIVDGDADELWNNAAQYAPAWTSDLYTYLFGHPASASSSSSPAPATIPGGKATFPGQQPSSPSYYGDRTVLPPQAAEDQDVGASFNGLCTSDELVVELSSLDITDRDAALAESEGLCTTTDPGGTRDLGYRGSARGADRLGMVTVIAMVLSPLEVRVGWEKEEKLRGSEREGGREGKEGGEDVEGRRRRSWDSFVEAKLRAMESAAGDLAEQLREETDAVPEGVSCDMPTVGMLVWDGSLPGAPIPSVHMMLLPADGERWSEPGTIPRSVARAVLPYAPGAADQHPRRPEDFADLSLLMTARAAVLRWFRDKRFERALLYAELTPGSVPSTDSGLSAGPEFCRGIVSEIAAARALVKTVYPSWRSVRFSQAGDLWLFSRRGVGDVEERLTERARKLLTEPNVFHLSIMAERHRQLAGVGPSLPHPFQGPIPGFFVWKRDLIVLASWHHDERRVRIMCNAPRRTGVGKLGPGSWPRAPSNWVDPTSVGQDSFLDSRCPSSSIYPCRSGLFARDPVGTLGHLKKELDKWGVPFERELNALSRGGTWGTPPRSRERDV